MKSLALPLLAALAALQPVLGAAFDARALNKRQHPNPTAQGNADQGWKTLPVPFGAAIHYDWKIGANQTPFPVLQSNDIPVQSAVKRAVIVLPGKLRDCWYYFNTAHNALMQASDKNIGVKYNEVSMMAPCFMTDLDQKAGSVPNPNSLLFGLTTWASGHYQDSPDSAGKISAYQVLDELVAYYMDRTAYPNLNTVVIAGHSLGAQMVQRYAAMRKTQPTDDRLHYWVANAGSLLWLVEDRPHPDLIAGCPDYDDFKYGLADGSFPGYALGEANNLHRVGLVERYRSRNVHYAWGMNDHGNGDTRCQAETQGDSHLERGQNYDAMLHNMAGGMPAAQTIDYMEGISHFNEGMFYSDQGINKVFVLNYNGTAAVAPPLKRGRNCS